MHCFPRRDMMITWTPGHDWARVLVHLPLVSLYFPAWWLLLVATMLLSAVYSIGAPVFTSSLCPLSSSLFLIHFPHPSCIAFCLSLYEDPVSPKSFSQHSNLDWYAWGRPERLDKYTDGDDKWRLVSVSHTGTATCRKEGFLQHPLIMFLCSCIAGLTMIPDALFPLTWTRSLPRSSFFKSHSTKKLHGDTVEKRENKAILSF